ncbi:MAG: hypothetical protein ABW022_09575 [Actinoplanes sp.]
MIEPGMGGVAAPGARGGSAAGRRGASPAPRPAWLPDDPVGPGRHAVPPGVAGQAPGAGRPRAGGKRPPFDPDNPWQVAEGVRPVITPGTWEERHDPGPNVIGRHG